jgi:predicted phosphodiesterase
MRVGLLSDVHANLPALQAALESLERRGVDQLVVAGDLVGYGGQPNECLATLAEVGAHCVVGNHDQFVLDRLPATRFPALARRSAELTRSMLTADSRAFLARLPIRLQAGTLLVTHGSLDSIEEYVVDERRAVDLLSRLPYEAPGADTLVLGHTHRQWCVVAGQKPRRPSAGMDTPQERRRLVNPGSVGQSRQRERRPRCRFALYDTSGGRIQFLRADYDVEASREVLRRLGLPDRCLHAPPRLHRQVIRAAARVMTRHRPVARPPAARQG